MDKTHLKELIQEIYDDYDFADFTLHFVNEVEPHKVYEIRNNRINNKLKDTTLIVSNIKVSNYQMKEMLLYGFDDVKEYFVRKMIEETADKILTDIYKVNNREWFYSQSSPVEIELTITNWQLHEEILENGKIYSLKFEIA
jgi:hypothetical protein